MKLENHYACGIRFAAYTSRVHEAINSTSGDPVSQHLTRVLFEMMMPYCIA